MKSYKFSIVMMCIFWACTRSEELTNLEKKHIDQEVRETLQNYYDDIRQSGLTAEFKYLDNSPEFFWAPPGYDHALSYDSISSIIQSNAAGLTKVNNRFDTLLIVPLKRKVASYTGRLTSTVTDTTGNTIIVHMIETGVMVKRNNQWKLINGQTSIIKSEDSSSSKHMNK